MNKIEAKIADTKFTKDHLAIFVDDIRLDLFISGFTKDDYCTDLIPAWSYFLENKNEQKYIWELIDSNTTEGFSLPILLCPDDLDLSCTTIIAKVLYNQDTVVWEKVGCVEKKNWNLEEWKRSGIMNLEKWSNEDWEKYGGHLDVFDLENPEWSEWASKNWNDEEMRRLRNYTNSFINAEENLLWFSEIPKLVFMKDEYMKCVDDFRKAQEN